MRLWNVFRVFLREQLRSPWDLVLVLAVAPGMVALYWSFLGGGSTSYTLLVLNQDQGICQTAPVQRSCAALAIEAIQNTRYTNGSELLHVVPVASRAAALPQLQNRKAAALLIFPADFSLALQNLREGKSTTSPRVTLVGDVGNPYYALAAIFANTALDETTRAIIGINRPFEVNEELLGGSASSSEFQIYVPGLIIAATTMMMFSVVIAISRQVESGTLRRLQLTRMTSLDFLGGITLLYLLISLASVGLTFATAVALGFQSRGSMLLAGLICVLVSFTVIGVGLLTACLSRTVARAAVIVNFPLILLLFFSGSVFPMPDITLFSISGRGIGVFDLLPHTHAVLALNKVLSLGVGIGDVLYELAAMLVLSLAFFWIGVWAFKRMHLSPR